MPKNKYTVQDSSKFMCEALTIATTSAVTDLHICKEKCNNQLKSNKILSTKLKNVRRQNVKLNTKLRSLHSEQQRKKTFKTTIKA